MSDFDEVLERLLNEPSFAAALAADPVQALAAYRLESDEADLLRQQFAPDASAGAAVVESRITKSSTFGLVSPLAGLADQIFGSGAAAPAAPAGHLGAWSEFGTAAGIGAREGVGSAAGIGTREGVGLSATIGVREGVGDAVPVREGIGAAPDAWGTGGGGPVEARSELGQAPDLDGLPAVSKLGNAPEQGLGERPSVLGRPTEQVGAPVTAHGRIEHAAAPKGYHNRVDADGDGSWDRATYRRGEHGGADILVDLDGDGRTDFIGHDTDADRTVDYADYDKNHDGVFEQRQYDSDGNGLLDRTVWRTD